MVIDSRWSYLLRHCIDSRKILLFSIHSLSHHHSRERGRSSHQRPSHENIVSLSRMPMLVSSHSRHPRHQSLRSSSVRPSIIISLHLPIDSLVISSSTRPMFHDPSYSIWKLILKIRSIMSSSMVQESTFRMISDILSTMSQVQTVLYLRGGHLVHTEPQSIRPTCPKIHIFLEKSHFLRFSRS
jgi:hypothetical protein